jgi:predicted NBD/HSP70 family sugar kinase
MNVLVVDVGGTNVKVLAIGQDEPRRFRSGPMLTAEQMVAGVKELTGEWPYDVVSIGYPGLVHEGRIVAEPRAPSGTLIHSTSGASSSARCWLSALSQNSTARQRLSSSMIVRQTT